MEVSGQLHALGCLTEFCDGEFAFKVVGHILICVHNGPLESLHYVKLKAKCSKKANATRREKLINFSFPWNLSIYMNRLQSGIS
jgi:hypothetical protein